MTALDLIVKKRNGDELNKQEIDFLVEGYTNKKIPEYQISAFLMAVFFKGMTFRETGFLTSAMIRSGETLDFYKMDYTFGLEGPFVDKHSTGGVGDKISLPLAPLVASLGVQVPMMSGRALGHTGGTLDKLESIEGYNVNLSKKEFARLIAKNGYAMMGQTQKIVPADRLLYALRDVTGTVESIPLITSSILSKKIAEGSDALVFDVKCGSGAFMKNLSQAENLANFLVQSSNALKKKSSALITNMDFPLGRTVGNFLEIEETIDILKGCGKNDVTELTFALAVEMLLIAKKAQNENEALEMCKNSIKNGAALKKFLQNVEDQGGDPEKLLLQYKTRRGKFKTIFTAKKSGFLKIDAYKTGLAAVALGVGREKTCDKVFAESGIVFIKNDGEKVSENDEIAELYGKNEESLLEAQKIMNCAIEYFEEKPKRLPLIIKKI